jgi:hypothetical protein
MKYDLPTLWKWHKGRQKDCEYFKFPLLYAKIYKFAFDAYILKYKEDTVLPEHNDPIKNAKHFRLNIGWGVANFCCDKLIFGRRIGKLTIFLFRPDINKHSLYIFENTTKLSIGFIKYN